MTVLKPPSSQLWVKNTEKMKTFWRVKKPLSLYYDLLEDFKAFTLPKTVSVDFEGVKWLEKKCSLRKLCVVFVRFPSNSCLSVKKPFLILGGLFCQEKLSLVRLGLWNIFLKLGLIPFIKSDPTNYCQSSYWIPVMNFANVCVVLIRFVGRFGEKAWKLAYRLLNGYTQEPHRAQY